MEISGLLSSHAVLMYFTLSFENSFYRMLEVCNGNQGEMKGPVFRLMNTGPEMMTNIVSISAEVEMI